MKPALLLVPALLVAAAEAIVVGQNQTLCRDEDRALRVLLQEKLAAFGVECEEMCHKIGVSKESCQCPGFAGNPASEGDTRSCIVKYCQDPSTPCPTDNFVSCVKENTKISALQWGALIDRFDAALGLGREAKKGREALVEVGSCQAMDSDHRAAVQARLAALGVECEEMCTRMGVKKESCQCPGFAGNPASAGDTRACFIKYCQDPATPCPTDNFVGCVKENTKVAVLLQWSSLLLRFDAFIGQWRKTVAGP